MSENRDESSKLSVPAKHYVRAPFPTLEEALKLCEKAKDDAKAGVAYKFCVLAKQVKAYFLDKIRDLGEERATIDLLIETARKERSEGGIGSEYECRMAHFALYVDYVAKKYGFEWDSTPFRVACAPQHEV